uniref:UDP-N-acetylglucosamine transporter n=1 Tax=Globisporangium ultimum (strain ATCC 200006 / CBS 805.95 / DAOM BR144) TaxID=431595 RepID=K3WVL5_GLOUD
MASATPSSLKYASLAVLCLQNSFLAILMRLSRVGDYPKFNTSTAVFMGEVFKLVTCIAIILKMPPAPVDIEKRVHASSLQVIFDQREMLRVSVPALLYVIQNNLQYVAVSNLDAATFQVLYQLKILTTAIFSVFLLGKAILPLQWGAIVILMGGVALVQLDDSGASNAAAANSAEQSMTMGLFAVVAACMCSGFAGVYFEKILKGSGSKATLWERNIQMGVVSIVLAGGGLLYNDMDHITAYGFFYGYRPVVWAAIGVSALGGLLTAVVVKYADNILKAFATSIAIVLSVIISIFLFDKVPTMQFIFGAVLVNVSVYIYGNAPSWKQTHSPLLPRTVASKSAKA